MVNVDGTMAPRVLVPHVKMKDVFCFELTALSVWAPVLPAKGATRNLLPQVTVGGICTAIGSHPTPVDGTAAH